MRLKDKVCIITGGGMGMGRAACLLFAREGAKVIVADVLAKEGQETVDLVNKAGGEAAFVQVDISKAAEAERMAKSATQKYGKVNVLYNNAGIYLPKEDYMIVELAEEVWDKIIDVNLKGTYLCCKYVIPELIKCGGGSIINVSSISGLVATELPAYSASKGGIIALTRVIARECAGKNIRANVICPGQVDTPMAAAGREARAQRPPQLPYTQGLLGRTSQPEEIAYLSLYLASDESSYVTGAVFPIDVGLTAV
jgi:NAD(P)-dependent dehydrogenase (short-subunit alcohol dehydrogenase family)